MRIYENAFPSSYEEIKTWYPVWYREVFEMDALWRVFGSQMDRIQADLIQMVENNFIEFADAPTVTRLEAFFGITHPIPRTLVERRAVLIGFVRGRGHIGRPKIIEIISLFTTGEIDVAFSRPGMIDVTVTRDYGDMFNLADIYMILGHRIPAHLTLGVIDRPRPVSVQNHNAFIFRDLLMLRFRIANITAPCILLDGKKFLDGTWQLGIGTIHGIKFDNFRVATSVRNYGIVAGGVLLNGQNILDGSFFLDGLKTGSLRGISARRLGLGAFIIPNKFNVSIGVIFPAVKASNTGNFQALRLDIKANIVNSGMTGAGILLNGQKPLDGNWPLGMPQSILNGLSARHFDAGIYTAQNNNRLGAGTLAKSSPWVLNGRLKLDGGSSAGGTQTLEKLIMKEEL